MRKISIHKGELVIRQRTAGFFEKPVTKFGTGAKIDCPKEFLGKKAIVVICNDGE